MTDWTTPADIVAQVERLWQKGAILRGLLQDESAVSVRLRFRKPSSEDLANRFDEVRAWIRSVEPQSKAGRGFGYELAWREVAHRQIGKNRLPVGAEVSSLRDAARLIGREADLDAFASLIDETRSREPTLLPWVGRHPLLALERHRAWGRALSVLSWLKANPNSKLYLRQIDIPDVDTKFIESQRDLLTQLTRALGVDVTTGTTLETAWGLRVKPRMVRFRILDPRLQVADLSDITLPIEDFARSVIGAKHVFVVENEVNGLAFPETAGSIVVFGLGYGAEILGLVEWMRNTSIHYWGDIDTHGFAILDRVRAVFPDVRSFLMDRETLLSHRASWALETSPSERSLTRLTPLEEALFADLSNNTYGVGIRLEQERIRFGHVARAVQHCVLADTGVAAAAL